MNECDWTSLLVGEPERHFKRLALAAAVQCTEMNSAEAEAARRAEMLASMGCSMGCKTCAVEEEIDDADLMVGCEIGQVMIDIEDATYGSAGEQPPWDVNMAMGHCNTSTGLVPRGKMCRGDDERVLGALRSRCVGRRMCEVSWNEIRNTLFPVDPCPGSLKRLSVIAVCRKSQLPIATYETPFPEEFNFLQHEERRLGHLTVSVEYQNIWHLRAAFQSSEDVVHQSTPKNMSRVAWGALEHTAKRDGKKYARRLLTTFTTPENVDAQVGSEGAGINLWRFRVVGSELFWQDAGMLAVLNVDHDRVGSSTHSTVKSRRLRSVRFKTLSPPMCDRIHHLCDSVKP